jgi:hypothetical protein
LRYGSTYSQKKAPIKVFAFSFEQSTERRSKMVGKQESIGLGSSNGRIQFLATIGLVLVTAWMALNIYGQGKGRDASSRVDDDAVNVHVALLETSGSHDEVTAALYYAIASVPGSYVSMYLTLQRFGIEKVFAWIRRRYKLSPYSISPPYQFQTDRTHLTDMIVLTTCEQDLYAVDTALHFNFEHGPKHQKLVCVMHHADRFPSVEQRVRRWARTGRLRFITLSTHTAHALRRELDGFPQDVYEKVDIDVFPPVFPAPLAPNPPPTDRLTIAIQGNFEDSRRDYLKTLLEFERMIEELPERIVSRLQFILAGSGKQVGVPSKVMPYVSVNFTLDFIPYYNLLHEAFALIPAFADEGYYNTKASSSIPASFIANCPILGSQRLMESYGYLTRESMWYTDDAGESEMNAIYELLRQHFEDDGLEKQSWKQAVKEKKQAVQKRASELMRENANLMRGIIQKKVTE